MANFPTSVFSPSARSNGQVIDASHVNDLQGEVTAIEGGYLNGTARLNSSNSTVANLSVTGGCTIAGTVNLDNIQSSNSTFAHLNAGTSTFAGLSVSGGSTVTTLQAGDSTLATLIVSADATFARLAVVGGSTLATVQVNGASTYVVRPTEPPPHAVSLLTTGVVHLTANTTLAVSWMGQDFVTNSSMHSTGSNPSLVTPQSTGVWAFSAAVTVTAEMTSATGVLNITVEDSSATILGRASVMGLTGPPASVHVCGFKRFDALGGSMRVITRLRDGATGSISVVGTRFQVHKL